MTPHPPPRGVWVLLRKISMYRHTTGIPTGFLVYQSDCYTAGPSRLRLAGIAPTIPLPTISLPFESESLIVSSDESSGRILSPGGLDICCIALQ